MKRYVISALVAVTLAGCAVQQRDTLGDELAQFRATRQIYARANLRCQQLVTEKYHGRLYGLTPVEGSGRQEIESAANNDRAACTVNYERKSAALWNEQSPEVHAFYAKRRAELRKEIVQVEAEAQR